MNPSVSEFLGFYGYIVLSPFQNSLTAVEHVKLEASAAEEQNLLYTQSDLRIEVVELTRLAAIKVGMIVVVPSSHLLLFPSTKITALLYLGISEHM